MTPPQEPRTGQRRNPVRLWWRLHKMGRHEHMRIALFRAGEPEVSGRIYCWCPGCKQARADLYPGSTHGDA